MNQSFFKGALILSISMFATKLLGIVYLVPFKALVGEEGMSLYGYAYTFYGLFISLSTLGIPVGLAKFISKYQAKGEYDVARKVFRLSLIGMSFFGVAGYLTMYFIAPSYVDHILMNELELIGQANDIVSVIRIVGVALLVIPVMALFRGFFQGNRTMTPTSVSQFIEQLIRVIVILVGSYAVVRIFNGTYQQAVSLSVFAAFISGLVSFLYLIYYWVKHKKDYDLLLKETKPHPDYSSKRLILELIQCSIPFALLGLATNLFQNIDTWKFHHLLTEAHVPFELQKTYYGMYIMELAKIVMIPVSFAMAFSQPLVPELTQAFQKKDFEGMRQTIYLAFRLTLFITIPAVIGMSLLSKPLFISFYQSSSEINEMGGSLFRVGCWLGLCFSLYSIISAILQGLNLQNKGILYLGLALVMKYFANQWLVPFFGVNGFVYSTFVAYALWVGLSLVTIKKVSSVSFRQLIKEAIPIVVIGGVMALVVQLAQMGMQSVFSGEGRLEAMAMLMGCGMVGAGVYFVATYKAGLIPLFLKQLKR